MIPKCYKKENLPHKFCPGCGYGVILKSLGSVIDHLKIANKSVIGLDIGCGLLAWNLFDVDTIQTHHGRTTPTMAGFKFAKPEAIVLAIMGDGGGYAIGLQSLLHSAHRNDPITVILVNNTLYAMTGGQMAPTTLANEITDTTPKGRDSEKTGLPFLGPEIIATLTNKQAYIARASIRSPLQVESCIEKAIKNQMRGKGFSFVEVLSICPTNWKTNAEESFKFLEKMEDVFVLGEIKKP
ncbi:MAG: thiamine pyrophosphate-dependent enzyme [Candidatus Berkelbacteria bacterium]|nr:thiamine pyrophosphate-dependent enzyme [Candidatus Berkelbacteria bacterium]